MASVHEYCALALPGWPRYMVLVRSLNMVSTFSETDIKQTQAHILAGNVCLWVTESCFPFAKFFDDISIKVASLVTVELGIKNFF